MGRRAGRGGRGGGLRRKSGAGGGKSKEDSKIWTAYRRNRGQPYVQFRYAIVVSIALHSWRCTSRVMFRVGAVWTTRYVPLDSPRPTRAWRFALSRKTVNPVCTQSQRLLDVFFVELLLQASVSRIRQNGQDARWTHYSPRS